jgi:hypothetical protein
VNKVDEGMNKKSEEKIRYDHFPSLAPTKKGTPIPSSSPPFTMIEDGINTKPYSPLQHPTSRTPAKKEEE